MDQLAGVEDPEEKRKIIGRVFIEVFEREAIKSGAKFLVQLLCSSKTSLRGWNRQMEHLLRTQK